MYQVKVQAVLMHRSGVSMYQICRELRVSCQSLHLWIAIYEEEGEQGLRKSFKSQLSSIEKLCIIEDVLNNELSLKVASKKYRVTREAIRQWINAYQIHGVSGLHRKNEACKDMAKKNCLHILCWQDGEFLL